eukprot:scaffold2191_cov392-Prasinococcus_capsulatus_cf.AAC.8
MQGLQYREADLLLPGGGLGAVRAPGVRWMAGGGWSSKHRVSQWDEFLSMTATAGDPPPGAGPDDPLVGEADEAGFDLTMLSRPVILSPALCTPVLRAVLAAQGGQAPHPHHQRQQQHRGGAPGPPIDVWTPPHLCAYTARTASRPGMRVSWPGRIPETAQRSGAKAAPADRSAGAAQCLLIRARLEGRERSGSGAKEEPTGHPARPQPISAPRISCGTPTLKVCRAVG